jgi:hypothetical protein
LIASSARIEQWIFTGGSASSSAIWLFLIDAASSSVLPLTHSVTSELEAMAEPQLHHVAAGGRPHHAGADVLIPLRERADVARVLVVFDDFLRI